MFFSSLSSDLFSALGKEFGMPSAIILPSVVSAALDKQLFCRVPDGMHSANILALSKSPVSGSVYPCMCFSVIIDDHTLISYVLIHIYIVKKRKAYNHL